MIKTKSKVIFYCVCLAWNNNEQGMKNICKNTKGIVFLSTPHLGAPLATLHEAWRILIMPSTELEELRYSN